MGESRLSHSHLYVCCPIRDCTEAEIAVSRSDLSNSMWGALARHEREGWREVETWGEWGGGGGGDKQEGDVRRWRMSEWCRWTDEKERGVNENGNKEETIFDWRRKMPPSSSKINTKENGDAAKENWLITWVRQKKSFSQCIWRHIVRPYMPNEVSWWFFSRHKFFRPVESEPGCIQDAE